MNVGVLKRHSRLKLEKELTQIEGMIMFQFADRNTEVFKPGARDYGQNKQQNSGQDCLKDYEVHGQ